MLTGSLETVLGVASIHSSLSSLEPPSSSLHSVAIYNYTCLQIDVLCAKFRSGIHPMLYPCRLYHIKGFVSFEVLGIASIAAPTWCVACKAL